MVNTWKSQVCTCYVWCSEEGVNLQVCACADLIVNLWQDCWSRERWHEQVRPGQIPNPVANKVSPYIVLLGAKKILVWPANTTLKITAILPVGRFPMFLNSNPWSMTCLFCQDRHNESPALLHKVYSISLCGNNQVGSISWFICWLLLKGC